MPDSENSDSEHPDSQNPDSGNLGSGNPDNGNSDNGNIVGLKGYYDQNCRNQIRVSPGTGYRGRDKARGICRLHGVALAGMLALLGACGAGEPAAEKTGPVDESSAAAAGGIEAGAEDIGAGGEDGEASRDIAGPDDPGSIVAENTDPATNAGPDVKTPGVSGVKLYALDCGTIGVSDLDIFSDAGDYAGEEDVFTNSCFLIRHPDGDLIWDFGLPAALVGAEPVTNGPFTLSLEQTIETQLAELELTPADIDFVAISHSHFDHVSQLAVFSEATLIVNPDELDHMVTTAQSDEDMAALLRVIEGMEKRYLDDPGGELDVFGDGTVGMFITPGHTPGHMSLLVNLAKTGSVLLTGDLYHRKESRQLGRVPRFNTDSEKTREAIALFELLAQSYNARVIIQHEPDDIAALPAFPEALE